MCPWPIWSASILPASICGVFINGPFDTFSAPILVSFDTFLAPPLHLKLATLTPFQHFLSTKISCWQRPFYTFPAPKIGHSDTFSAPSQHQNFVLTKTILHFPSTKNWSLWHLFSTFSAPQFRADRHHFTPSQRQKISHLDLFSTKILCWQRLFYTFQH